MVAIGFHRCSGVVGHHGFGDDDVLGDGFVDIARHGAGDTAHVEADVVEPLRQRAEQPVVGGVVERLVEFDVEQAERYRIVEERAAVDGVVREGLYERIEAVFRAFNWNVITLKYGALQRRAFAEPGGDRLKSWIDACPNDVYSALMFRGGAAWRARLEDEIGDQGPVTAGAVVM